MEKNKEINNILKFNKIRDIIKDKHLKINKESLDELDKITNNFLLKLISNIDYDLKIGGRKSIKEEDVKKAFDKLIKEERYFEI